MKKEEPMRNINPFGLRMQPELKAKVEAAAEKNRRSINAEIHARLEETFYSEDSVIERGCRFEKLKGKADPQLESLVSSFVAQIELEIQRQAEQLAEERIRKE